MKTAIIGCRTAGPEWYSEVVAAATQLGVTEVVSGGAPGADALGERFARENRLPLTVLAADWSTHGKMAGRGRLGRCGMPGSWRPRK